EVDSVSCLAHAADGLRRQLLRNNRIRSPANHQDWRPSRPPTGSVSEQKFLREGVVFPAGFKHRALQLRSYISFTTQREVLIRGHGFAGQRAAYRKLRI